MEFNSRVTLSVPIMSTMHFLICPANRLLAPGRSGSVSVTSGSMADDPLAPLAALPVVIAAVADARDAVDRVLTNRVLRRRSSEVSAESALRGAWAAAVRSGADVELAAMRAGDVADPSRPRSAAGLGRTRPVERDLATGAAPGAGPVARTRCRGSRRTRVVGPPDRGTPLVTRRLDLLADTVSRTRAPAVVVAGVVLGEILGLDAFAPSSVVVGYGAARLTLVEFGLDPKALAVDRGRCGLELWPTTASGARGLPSPVRPTGSPRGSPTWP